MRRNLLLAFFFCFSAIAAPAQNRINGKWEGDPSSSRGQSVQLEVTVDGDKASGTLSLGGLDRTFYVFQDSKVTGNKVQFRPDSNPAWPIWTVELVDENTLNLYRGSLPIGNNVLNLLSLLGDNVRPVPAVPVASTSGPPSARVPTFVQNATAGSIGGTIQDRNKALIPSVTVTVTNIDSGAKQTATSNDVGTYHVLFLIPGAYTLTMALPGFASMTVSNLQVSDTEVVQNLTLEFSESPPSVDQASCAAGGIAWCTVLHRAK